MSNDARADGVKAAEATTELRGAPRSRAAAVLVSVPDRLMTILLAATIAVSIAVAVRFFSPWLVIPLFAVCLVLLWRFAPALPSRRPFESTCPLAMFSSARRKSPT